MGYPEEQWYISPEAYESSLEGSFTDEPKGLYGKDLITEEEYDMVSAIRELDSLSRQGIYLTVMNELNEALREKKVKSEERKKRLLKKALKTLNKAVGEYA